MMKSKNIWMVLFLLSIALVGNAQETVKVRVESEEQDQVFIKVKPNSSPDLYIDGKKYDSAILDLIDPDKIESIAVLKGEEALEKYNAPNGVLLIRSKKGAKSDIAITQASKEEMDLPVVFIDDTLSDQKSLETIAPDDIQSIDVIKGKKAEESYGAPQGVIIIKTQKKKK